MSVTERTLIRNACVVREPLPPPPITFMRVSDLPRQSTVDTMEAMQDTLREAEDHGKTLALLEKTAIELRDARRELKETQDFAEQLVEKEERRVKAMEDALRAPQKSLSAWEWIKKNY